MGSSIQKTLLEIVQEILSTTDSDNVNSISDTEESLQVAKIVQDTYFDLIANREIPEHEELSTLESLADSTRPTYLRMPANARKLCTFDYNVSTTGSVSFREILYKTPDEFLSYLRSRESTDTDTQTMLDINGGTTLIIRNNQMPTYYTSFDDKHIVCDSFRSVTDSVLQTSKTRALVTKVPTFDLIDSAIPDLDDTHLRFLVNEAKSIAYSILTKQVNPKIEQTARRQRVFSQNDKSRIGGYPRINRFGR